MRRLIFLLLVGCTSPPASAPAIAPAPVTPVVTVAPAAVAPVAVAKAPVADTRDPEDRWSCGDEPLAPCPLQGFMEAVLAPASKRRDWVAVEEHLHRLAELAPKNFTDWREIALSGAAAAHGANIEGVRAACGACHENNKARYRRELRDRPLSTGRNQ